MKLFLFLSSLFAFSVCTHAHEYRNQIQKEAGIFRLKSILQMDRSWVSYPGYKDRNGWDILMGELKNDIIRKGEESLNHEWKVVKATDYLEFEKSGSRRIVEALLENDPDKLAQGVHRTMVSVDKFINYNHVNGACEEGPSYWGHAAAKMYDHLHILYYATNSELSIFNEPAIKNLGKYVCISYIRDGWVVNFADASAKGGGDKDVIFRYGKAVGSQEMQKFAVYLRSRDRNKGYSGGVRDIFRNLENLVFYNELAKTSPEIPKTSFSWYPQTEFCYMRNSSGFFLAAKDGYNNESHNHNDAGSLLLYFNNKPVFIEVGAGTYTRQTFSNERFSIWTMQSDYHNLPLINGKPQDNSAQYRSKNVIFDEKKLRFSVDISGGCDSDAAINSWIRSYSMATQGEVIIENVFNLAKAIEPNQVNFITHAQPDISIDGVVKLLVDGNKVQLTCDKKRFTPASETIKLDDTRLSNIWGYEIYRISLTAKDNQMKGTCKFTVKAI